MSSVSSPSSSEKPVRPLWRRLLLAVSDWLTEFWRQVRDSAIALTRWIVANPLSALLIVATVATLVYFFGCYRVFQNSVQSAAEWTVAGWNVENDQQHCYFIVPIILYLLWHHRAQLAAAPRQPSTRGLWFVITGTILFVLAVRCLQPRFAIFALPLIIYGTAEFLGGRAVARVFIFPCLLILFMVPIGGVIQSTVSLQLFASQAVGALCSLFGITAEILGTKISVNGHPFEVAGGCSGIRSLMAMTMLTALYVHFTQNTAWKKWVIFGGSIAFAFLGNIARLFSVVLVAKWWSPEIAGGQWHDYSGLVVFFPSAVLSMVLFSNLLNHDWKTTAPADIERRRPATSPSTTSSTEVASEEANKPASPVSYDY